MRTAIASILGDVLLHIVFPSHDLLTACYLSLINMCVAPVALLLIPLCLAFDCEHFASYLSPYCSTDRYILCFLVQVYTCPLRRVTLV